MILIIKHVAEDQKKKGGENRSAAFRVGNGGRKQKENSTEKSKITLYNINPWHYIFVQTHRVYIKTEP